MDQANDPQKLSVVTVEQQIGRSGDAPFARAIADGGTGLWIFREKARGLDGLSGDTCGVSGLSW
ncbi:MAG: hypothetical protein WDN44_08410 [Sphingomonas sp.]